MSVIGAQSTGKSKLLNNLFGTDFGVLDTKLGRNLMNQGIWLAKSSFNTSEDNEILFLDLEGSDS